MASVRGEDRPRGATGSRNSGRSASPVVRPDDAARRSAVASGAPAVERVEVRPARRPTRSATTKWPGIPIPAIGCPGPPGHRQGERGQRDRQAPAAAGAPGRGTSCAGRRSPRRRPRKPGARSAGHDALGAPRRPRSRVDLGEDGGGVQTGRRLGGDQQVGLGEVHVPGGDQLREAGAGGRAHQPARPRPRWARRGTRAWTTLRQRPLLPAPAGRIAARASRAAAASGGPGLGPRPRGRPGQRSAGATGSRRTSAMSPSAAPPTRTPRSGERHASSPSTSRRTSPPSTPPSSSARQAATPAARRRHQPQRRAVLSVGPVGADRPGARAAAPTRSARAASEVSNSIPGRSARAADTGAGVAPGRVGQDEPRLRDAPRPARRGAGPGAARRTRRG